MSVPENIIYTAKSNVSLVDFKFEMPDNVFVLYILYLTGSMSIGIPGNFIVLAIYQKLKPSTNIDCYIVSIAGLDIVCLVVTVPMYIVIQTQLWDVTDVNTFCKTLIFTGQLVTFAESFLLCAMAIERFLKVCRPNLTSSPERQGKNIAVSILVTTCFISVPNLLFSWDDYNRNCLPIANPQWIASVFFLFTVSLLIIVFGIISFSYTSVAKKLFQTARKTTQNSIASRNIIRRNMITPLPCQMNLRPTTSCMFKKKTNETSLSLQTNITNIKVISSSQQLVMGETACSGRHHYKRDPTNSEIKEDNENYIKNITIQGKTNWKSVHRLGRRVRDLSQCDTAIKVKQGEKVVRETFENMSLPQKRRFLRTTKVSVLITVTFIISWLPVWIYTVLAFAKTLKDPYGGFFLKQSYLINTCMNPFLYIACSRKFRYKAKELFLKHQSIITF
ncbi:hypothetical protein ACJMK2_018579 [Sinanodonta woodiana]|uniref:G-protein coupled receptors family 1 profile domain-containing protein n=1 Tax=Sinanodonta woodiana TaxID=1069815 RepID=A0ABD3UDX9_SINWO